MDKGVRKLYDRTLDTFKTVTMNNKYAITTLLVTNWSLLTQLIFFRHVGNKFAIVHFQVRENMAH